MNALKCRLLFTAICGLSLSASPSVFAGHGSESVFKKMDSDGDGKITRAEHATAGKDFFKKCDVDKDSIVTADEMDTATAAKEETAAKPHKSSAEKIKAVDTNGDGQLTFAEYEAGSEKMFSKMDTNSDGALSKAECDEAHKELKK